MNANKTLLRLKYTRVICEFAKRKNISLNDALDIFYKSEVFIEMSNGISDMHCRSDEYLAEELCEEVQSPGNL
jgi:hypothetical protein